MKKKWLFFVVGIALLAALSPFLVGAASSSTKGDYEIKHWTVDGGGGYNQGGEYALQGTIGQHDAGFQQGGDYLLQGGFWFQGIQEILEFFIHLPLILR